MCEDNEWDEKKIYIYLYISIPLLLRTGQQCPYTFEGAGLVYSRQYTTRFRAIATGQEAVNRQQQNRNIKRPSSICNLFWYLIVRPRYCHYSRPDCSYMGVAKIEFRVGEGRPYCCTHCAYSATLYRECTHTTLRDHRVVLLYLKPTTAPPVELTCLFPVIDDVIRFIPTICSQLNAYVCLPQGALRGGGGDDLPHLLFAVATLG